MTLSVKQKQTHRQREQTCVGIARCGGGKDREFEISGYKLYIGWINYCMAQGTEFKIL